jgi:hypothetical protein
MSSYYQGDDQSSKRLPMHYNPTGPGQYNASLDMSKKSLIAQFKNAPGYKISDPTWKKKARN